MRATTFLILLSATVLLLSCSAQEEEDMVIPSYVMPREKYIRLMCDMALAEAAVNVNVKGIPSQQYDSVYAFHPLKENGISNVDYDSTLAFYSRHPKLFKAIYEEVLTELSTIQSSKANVKKDSLHKTVK